MSFVVENKINNMMYKVFDISYDKKGYPHFLIYKDNQWIRISAKHFRPIEVEHSPTGDVLRG
jgi:hypothetical protein